VRELEHMIERLIIMCEGDAIDADLLPVGMVATTRASENHVPTTLAEGGVNLNAIVRELEGRMINEARARPAATSRRRRACWASSARLLPPSSGEAA
jgi:DNA-binding NtrC family response regulator